MDRSDAISLRTENTAKTSVYGSGFRYGSVIKWPMFVFNTFLRFLMPSHKSNTNTNRYVTQLGGQERYYLEKNIARKKSELSNLELSVVYN